VVSKSKTKYTKINKNIVNLEEDLIMNGQVFEGVQNFGHFGPWINSNKFSDEIRSRIVAGNTVCPTHYLTRHFFNNSNTNKDTATKFEQEYVLN